MLFVEGHLRSISEEIFPVNGLGIGVLMDIILPCAIIIIPVGVSLDEGDVATSTAATTTDDAVDDTRGSSGGGSSWGSDDDEPARRDSVSSIAAADDDVTICGILNDPCYLLHVDGFGLGWDLQQFAARGFDLRMSLAALVDAAVGEEDKLYIRYYDGRAWHIADVIPLSGELSNFTNGGHFTVPMPEITDWHELDDLEVQIEYVPGGSTRAEVYVDSVWVDARYEALDDEELPELPQLYEELQALEDSAQPDTLVLEDLERIEFEHTDENENETLIIKSDKKTYEGLSRTKVYFNVTNISERADQFHLQVHFPEAIGEVSTLKQYTKNIPVTYEEPIMQPMALTCVSTWRWSAEDTVADEALGDVSTVPTLETDRTGTSTDEETVDDVRATTTDITDATSTDESLATERLELLEDESERVLGIIDTTEDEGGGEEVKSRLRGRIPF